MVAAATDTSIIVPTFNGRRGNPVLWGCAHFARLTALAGDIGARTLFSEYADRLTEIAWADDAIMVDVDDSGQLERVRARAAASRERG
jgi:molybdenum cofactor cytidylyltransferase